MIFSSSSATLGERNTHLFGVSHQWWWFQRQQTLLICLSIFSLTLPFLALPISFLIPNNIMLFSPIYTSLFSLCPLASFPRVFIITIVFFFSPPPKVLSLMEKTSRDTLWRLHATAAAVSDWLDDCKIARVVVPLVCCWFQPNNKTYGGVLGAVSFLSFALSPFLQQSFFFLMIIDSLFFQVN